MTWVAIREAARRRRQFLYINLILLILPLSVGLFFAFNLGKEREAYIQKVAQSTAAQQIQDIPQDPRIDQLAKIVQPEDPKWRMPVSGFGGPGPQVPVLEALRKQELQTEELREEIRETKKSLSRLTPTPSPGGLRIEPIQDESLTRAFNRMEALERQADSLTRLTDQTREELRVLQRQSAENHDELLTKLNDLARRLDAIEKRSASSFIVREGGRVLIPSLGLQAFPGTALLTKSSSGRKKIYNNFRITQMDDPHAEAFRGSIEPNTPVDFTYEGCKYRLFVRDLTKVPTVRDFLEVSIDRECKIPE